MFRLNRVDWMLANALLCLLVWYQRSVRGCVQLRGGALAAPTCIGRAEVRGRDVEMRLAQNFPDWAQEDIQPLLETIKRFAHGGLLECLDALFDSCEVAPQCGESGPRIPIQAIESWLWLSDQYDQDVLLTYWLAFKSNWAERYVRDGLRRGNERGLLDWGASCTILDRDMERLLAAGAADMHMHFGGVRSPLVEWLRWTDAAIWGTPWEPSPAGAGQTAALAQVRRLLELSRHSESKDGVDTIWGWSIRIDDSAPDENRPGWLSHRLREERAMLLNAWLELRLHRERAHQGSGYAESAERTETMWRLHASLDRYATAKAIFMRCKHQPLRLGNPGLAAFVEYFMRGFGATAKPFGESWRGVMRADQLRVFDYLAQSPALRRAELRQEAFARPGMEEPRRRYMVALRMWTELEAEAKVQGTQTVPDIRFAVHFKRTRKAGADNVRFDPEFPPDVQIRAHFDRESAELQRLRCDGIDGEEMQLVSRIRRIDLAGKERDMAPYPAFFAMRLLRGDALAHACLKPAAAEQHHLAGAGVQPVFRASRAAHAEWLDLYEQRRLIADHGMPELGMTCHAGEDFGHPLEGIANVGMVLEGLALGPGDTIGHALALGWDFALFKRMRQGTTYLAEGAQFDSLLWLHRTFAQSWPAVHLAQRAEIETYLIAKSRHFYSEPCSLHDLHELVAMRYGPCPPPPDKTADKRVDQFNPTALDLFRSEVWKKSCYERRAEKTACDPLFNRLDGLGGIAQQRVLDTIREQGVIVEINPSSNLRISRAPSLAEAPFIRLVRELAPHRCICINSDNPGVYRTRIEQEYAIVYAGLIQSGVPRAEALGWLEDMRVTGMERVY